MNTHIFKTNILQIKFQHEIMFQFVVEDALLYQNLALKSSEQVRKAGEVGE